VLVRQPHRAGAGGVHDRHLAPDAERESLDLAGPLINPD